MLGNVELWGPSAYSSMRLTRRLLPVSTQQ
jgi:hypothetical protein